MKEGQKRSEVQVGRRFDLWIELDLTAVTIEIEALSVQSIIR